MSLTVEHLIYLVILLFVFHYFISRRVEGVENTSGQVQQAPDTIVGMENAYTNIYCVNENLPVIKLGTGSISCLSPNANEANCLKYTDFNVPSDYSCTDSHKSLNNYLSKDGIRDTSSTSRKLFDSLMSKGYYNHTCDVTSLNDPNHWCGQVFKTIQNKCNSKKNIFEKNSDRLCNDELFKNPPTSKVALAFGSGSITSQINKCKNVNCARAIPKGLTKQQCQDNCSICYQPNCN